MMEEYKVMKIIEEFKKQTISCCGQLKSVEFDEIQGDRCSIKIECEKCGGYSFEDIQPFMDRVNAMIGYLNMLKKLI